MLPFLRTDLAQTIGYKPNPGHGSCPHDRPLDALDTNESPFDLPAALKQTLATAYQTEIQTNRYPDGSHQLLKTWVQDYVNESRQYGHPALKTNPSPSQGFGVEHLSLGNGSDELIRSLLIATCLPQCGSVLVADPTFSMYGILAESLGIPVVRVGRNPDDFAIDWMMAQEAIDRPPAGFPPVRIVFMVHPNSPTANGLSEAEVRWLESIPEEVLVVIDEAYFEFSQSTLIDQVLERSNWVITRTFSKAFRLAAHRVGYAVGHPELIAVLEKLRLPYNLPTFSQTAAIVALQHRTQILEGVTAIIAERDRLTQVLKAIPALHCYPTVGNFLFVRLRQASPEHYQYVLEQLHDRGTLIRYTGHGLRITIGDEAMNHRTSDRLQAVLKTLPF